MASQQRTPLRTQQRFIATILRPFIRRIAYTGGSTVDAEEDSVIYYQFRVEMNLPNTCFNVYVTTATAQRFFRPFLSPQDRNLLHDLPSTVLQRQQRQQQQRRRVSPQPVFRTPQRRHQGKQNEPLSQDRSTPLSQF